MKKAIVILNRNMPLLVNNFIKTLQNIDADIFVLENGSHPENYSKYSTIFEINSYGIAWGLNKLMQHCYDLNYDYIWVNYNDVSIEKPKEFFEWAVNSIENNPKIGVCNVFWGSQWDMSGNKTITANQQNNNFKNQMISFFDDLSFVVSKKALQVISQTNHRLTPFFDSSNYTNHYGILAPAEMLYKAKMCMITNQQFIAQELRNPAELDSQNARGFDDKYWKETKGPEDIDKWLMSFYPELSLLKISNKQKRDTIIKRICSYSNDYENENC